MRLCVQAEILPHEWIYVALHSNKSQKQNRYTNLLTEISGKDVVVPEILIQEATLCGYTGLLYDDCKFLLDQQPNCPKLKSINAINHIYRGRTPILRKKTAK